jgi:hypothetical protein
MLTDADPSIGYHGANYCIDPFRNGLVFALCHECPDTVCDVRVLTVGIIAAFVLFGLQAHFRYLVFLSSYHGILELDRENSETVLQGTTLDRA